MFNFKVKIKSQFVEINFVLLIVVSIKKLWFYQTQKKPHLPVKLLTQNPNIFLYDG